MSTATMSAVEQATEDHRQAVKLLAALEERVRAGDAGVKPAELRDARELVEYAALRIEAARRKETAAATKARHARYAEMGQRARALDLGGDVAILEAFGQAVEALERLYVVAEERSRMVCELVQEATAVAVEASDHGERQMLRDAGMERTNITTGPPNIGIRHADGRGETVQDVPPAVVVSAALGKVFTADPSRLEHMREYTGAPVRCLTLAGREFPALVGGGDGGAPDHSA